jgi:two-component system cell cycle sensor histidine kinase/response regulator CckA
MRRTHPHVSEPPARPSDDGDAGAQSERRYQALFEGMPIALFRVRADGVMVAANQALADLLGFETVEDAMTHKSTEAYVDPATRLRLIDRLSAGEDFVSYETQFKRAGGETIWVNCRTRAIRDANGRLECIEGAMADVSDRVAVEAALRESEERYRNLFDDSPLPTWVFDQETLAFLAVNDAAVRQYGYSREEFLSMTLLDIRPREDASLLREALVQARTTNRDYKGCFRHRKKDGTLIYVDIGTHRFTFGGRPAELAVARDTTEATRTEIELRETRDRLRHILASSNTVLFMLSPNDGAAQLEYMSDSIERLTGFTADEARVDGWWELNLHPEDVERAVADFAQVTADRDRTIEYRFRTKSKHYIWMRSTMRIVPTEFGESRIIGTWIDITEQKSLETQLFQSQKMEAVGKLAGGIAHDFNNILTAILGTAELGMMNPALGIEARRDLESIRDAGQRAAKITRQLLAFGRKQVIRPRTVLMNDTVQELLPMLNRLLTMTVSLETELAATGAIEVDPVQLEQVMLNLAVNARDAMPEGGTLTIGTRDLRIDGGNAADGQAIPAADYVALEVRDTGVGMDVGTQARIFEPFFTTKAPGAGTGLGLATVYGIVKQSAGHILVRSTVGVGTTFTIAFPRATAAAVTVEPIRQADVRGDEVVLVVEDEAAVRAPMCRALKEFGYTVLEAKHGADALLVLSAYKSPIDLVISDVMMPEMTGTELVSTLKRWYPKLRAILVSGYSEELISAQGAMPSGVRYLPKPFSIVDLARTAREILDEDPAPMALAAS